MIRVAVCVVCALITGWGIAKEVIKARREPTYSISLLDRGMPSIMLYRLKDWPRSADYTSGAGDSDSVLMDEYEKEESE